MKVIAYNKFLKTIYVNIELDQTMKSEIILSEEEYQTYILSDSSIKIIEV